MNLFIHLFHFFIYVCPFIVIFFFFVNLSIYFNFYIPFFFCIVFLSFPIDSEDLLLSIFSQFCLILSVFTPKASFICVLSM